MDETIDNGLAVELVARILTTLAPNAGKSSPFDEHIRKLSSEPCRVFVTEKQPRFAIAEVGDLGTVIISRNCDERSTSAECFDDREPHHAC